MSVWQLAILSYKEVTYMPRFHTANSIIVRSFPAGKITLSCQKENRSHQILHWGLQMDNGDVAIRY